jgi:hypothetical protein
MLLANEITGACEIVHVLFFICKRGKLEEISETS